MVLCLVSQNNVASFDNMLKAVFNFLYVVDKLFHCLSNSHLLYILFILNLIVHLIMRNIFNILNIVLWYYNINISFCGNLISAKLFPHCLKLWVIFNLFIILWPLDFVFVFGLLKNSSPIFPFHFLFNNFDVTIGIFEDIDSLSDKISTSTLAFCI